jgi:hypothetical protein
MNDIILKWKQIKKKKITLSTGTKINTVHFADGQVMTVDSVDNLQREA